MNVVDCCGKACWTEDWQYLNISIATPISISISNQTWSDQCPSSSLSENSNACKLSHKCATTTVLRLMWLKYFWMFTMFKILTQNTRCLPFHRNYIAKSCNGQSETKEGGTTNTPPETWAHAYVYLRRRMPRELCQSFGEETGTNTYVLCPNISVRSNLCEAGRVMRTAIKCTYFLFMRRLAFIDFLFPCLHIGKNLQWIYRSNSE